MRLHDKTLTCIDCEDPFIFTAGEQQMNQVRGRIDEPQRCPRCFRRVGQRSLRFGLHAFRQLEI
jgi:hypothetical protein